VRKYKQNEKEITYRIRPQISIASKLFVIRKMTLNISGNRGKNAQLG